MPIHDYHCVKCDLVIKDMFHVSVDFDPPSCPECFAPMEQLVGNVGLKFIGGGWYVNDYGNHREESSSVESTNL